MIDTDVNSHKVITVLTSVSVPFHVSLLFQSRLRLSRV